MAEEDDEIPGDAGANANGPHGVVVKLPNICPPELAKDGAGRSPAKDLCTFRLAINS